MTKTTTDLPPGTAAHPAHRLRRGQWETVSDLLAIEAPLEMCLQPADGAPLPVSITMRTPGQDGDLILGYLLSEGILKQPTDVVAVKQDVDTDRVTVVLRAGAAIDWSRLTRQGVTSASCGVCGKTSLEGIYVTPPGHEPLPQWTVAATLLCQLPGRLRDRQELFACTGGIHGAGLFDRTGRLVAHREDVGRHNALDKLLGYAFAQSWLPLHDHILLLSGRASFELLQKAAIAGIPVVVAVGAPSSLAVRTAQAAGITLVGFAAAERLNIYCNADRIVRDA
jgi:FdhD protein